LSHNPKEAENKIDHLELNLSRIEETSQNITGIERKVNEIRSEYKSKLETIQQGAEHIKAQLISTNRTLQSWTSAKGLLRFPAMFGNAVGFMDNLVKRSRGSEVEGILDTMNIMKFIMATFDSLTHVIASQFEAEVNRRLHVKVNITRLP
jgi:hypothetical protein